MQNASLSAGATSLNMDHFFIEDIFQFRLEEGLSTFLTAFSWFASNHNKIELPYIRQHTLKARESNVWFDRLSEIFSSIDSSDDPLTLFIDALNEFNQMIKDFNDPSIRPLDRSNMDTLKSLFKLTQDDYTNPLTHSRHYYPLLLGNSLFPKILKAVDSIRIPIDAPVDAPATQPGIFYDLQELSPTSRGQLVSAITARVQNSRNTHPVIQLRNKIARYYYAQRPLLLRSIEKLPLKDLISYAPQIMPGLCQIYTDMLSRPTGVDINDHALGVVLRDLIPFLERILQISFAREPSQPRQLVTCILAWQLLEAFAELAKQDSVHAHRTYEASLYHAPLTGHMLSLPTPPTPAESLLHLLNKHLDQEPWSRPEHFHPQNPQALQGQSDQLLRDLEAMFEKLPIPALSSSPPEVRQRHALAPHHEALLIPAASAAPAVVMRRRPCCSLFLTWSASFFYPLSSATAVTYLRLAAMLTVVAANIFDSRLTEPDPYANGAFLGLFGLLTLLTNVIQFRVTAFRDLMRLGGERIGCRFLTKRDLLQNPAIVLAATLVATGAMVGAAAEFKQLVINTENLNTDGEHQSPLNNFAVYAWTLATYAFLAFGMETFWQAVSILAGLMVHCSRHDSCWQRQLNGGAEFVRETEMTGLVSLNNDTTGRDSPDPSFLERSTLDTSHVATTPKASANRSSPERSNSPFTPQTMGDPRSPHDSVRSRPTHSTPPRTPTDPRATPTAVTPAQRSTPPRRSGLAGYRFNTPVVLTFAASPGQVHRPTAHPSND